MMNDQSKPPITQELVFFSRDYPSYTELDGGWSSDGSEQHSPREATQTLCERFRVGAASLLLGLCWNLSSKLHTNLFFQWSATTTRQQLYSSSIGVFFAYLSLGILFEPDDVNTRTNTLQTLIMYTSLADAIGASLTESPGLDTLCESIIEPFVGQMIFCALVYLAFYAYDSLCELNHVHQATTLKNNSIVYS